MSIGIVTNLFRLADTPWGEVSSKRCLNMQIKDRSAAQVEAHSDYREQENAQK
jgi:hypothetical protein